MVDFRKFDSSELEMFLKSVEGTSVEKDIRTELERRKLLGKYSIEGLFSSSYIPDFNSNFMCNCKQLLMEFDVMRLPYFWKSACLDSGNNLLGDFNLGMFGKDRTSIEKKWMYNLAYLSLLFSDEKIVRQYEGTYNNINYLINSIYRNINRYGGPIDCIDILFIDRVEKEKLVREKFSEVVEYLLDIRNDVPGSRCSIGNYGLSANKNKVRTCLSAQQEALVEAVSFGCSSAELKRGDFEGAKKLIYLPQQKIRK